MFDDIQAYFIENVLASYSDFKRSRNELKAGQSLDLRKALVAANSLYHFREHLPIQYKKTRKELLSLCADYDLLGDIVNASKHNTLTNNWKYLNSADSIYEQIIITRYQDSEGEYFNISKIICVDLVDGKKRYIFDILTNVLNMWYKYLFEISILQKENQVVIDIHEQPISRNKATGNKLAFEAIQNVRFRQVVKLQEFNYTTNKIEDVKLDGSEIKMGIYKQNYEADLKLIHNETKKEIVIPIKLTEEDMFQINQLKNKNENELQTFLFNLAEKQGSIKFDLLKKT